MGCAELDLFDGRPAARAGLALLVADEALAVVAALKEEVVLVGGASLGGRPFEERVHGLEQPLLLRLGQAARLARMGSNNSFSFCSSLRLQATQPMVPVRQRWQMSSASSGLKAVW